MEIIDLFYLLIIFIVFMLGYRYADRWVKTLPVKTVKIVNWIGFMIGIIGGLLWYSTQGGAFMFLCLIGIVIYFLFYGYDNMEEEEEEKKIFKDDDKGEDTSSGNPGNTPGT